MEDGNQHTEGVLAATENRSETANASLPTSNEGQIEDQNGHIQGEMTVREDPGIPVTVTGDRPNTTFSQRQLTLVDATGKPFLAMFAPSP